jgi:hypothetical protein
MAITNHPVDLALRKPGDILSLGNIVATSALLRAIGEAEAGSVLAPLIQRHVKGDWGDMPAVDKETNDEALASGEGRVMSEYSVEVRGEWIRIWIITEADRSVTTALLPDDY